MAPDRTTAALRRITHALVGGALVAAVVVVHADDRPAAGIYRCEVNGKRITSDRPIPECSHREQQLLNADGSVRRIVPPSMTADERAAAEAAERQAMAERVARQDAIRRDRNLMARFPNEAAHAKARKAALDDVENSIRISQARIKILQGERKKLDDEAEFYPGKPLPAKLKSAIDANDASLEAQQSLIQNQEAEKVRINALYDTELQHLRQLWAGAPAGSMGTVAGPNSGPPLANTKAPPPKALEAAAGRTKPQ